MKLWAKHIWMYVSKGDLATEIEQCRDEGKDLGALQGEFDALQAEGTDDADLAFQARTARLLDRTARLRPKAGHPFKEPNDLAGIRKARRERPALPKATLSDEALYDKAYGVCDPG